MKKLILAALFMAALAAPALAQSPTPDPTPTGTQTNVSWLSLSRLSIGLGADHAKVYTDQASVLTGNEWEAGAFFAYALGPHVAATASVIQGLDSGITTSRIGVRVVVFRGN